MANIALDIKANTNKALGEFKKLSRELDNKFLVQGLKLDVVKNAFRQINREFEQSLGQQGFDASQSTNKIQRNAAANLALLKNISVKSAFEVTKAVREQLQTLEAEGKLTGEVVNQALNVAGAFTFSGSVEQIRAQKSALAKEFATLSQSLNTAFDSNITNEILNVLTGKASVDDLQTLNFGPGGAGGNLLRSAILEQFAGFDSLVGEERTKAVEQIVKQFKEGNGKIAQILQFGLREAEKDDPFTRINMELKGLFSPRGLFGNLRVLNSDVEKEYRNFNNQMVDNNLLQRTADLVRTIFDKEKGLFAILGRSLKEVFGLDPRDALAPVFVGVKLLTEFFESVGVFFASPQFKGILEAFKPFAEAIKGIKIADGISVTEINNFIDGIFEGIRGLFSKVGNFIKNIDAKAIGDVVGNFFGEIIASLPDLLTVVFNSLTKLIDIIIEALNSDGFDSSKIGTVIATLLNGLVGLLPKVIELITTALPKIASALLAAFNETDFTTKLALGALLAPLLGGAIAKGINSAVRGLTGEGIVGRGKRIIQNFLERKAEGIPILGRLFRGAGNTGAAAGSDTDRWNRLYEKLDRIIDCVCGLGLNKFTDLLDFRRRPGRGRSPNFRPFRPQLPGTRVPRASLPPVTPRVPPGPRFQAPRIPGSPVSVIPRGTNYRPGSIDVTPIRPGAPRSPVPGTGGAATTGLFRNIRNFFTQATNRIPRVNPLQGAGSVLNKVRQSVSTLVETTRAQGRLIGRTIPSVAQFARTQGASIGRVLTDYNPLRSRFRPDRTVPFTSPATIPGRTAEGIRYRAPQIPSPTVPRVPPAAGGGGILNRILGAGRNVGRRAAGTLRNIPYLGSILAGLSIASIAAAPGAKAGELEEQGYTKEEIEKIKKQEGRNKTRGILGVLGGIGGGALAGGVVGAKLGAAGLNPFTVKVGAILGTLIGGVIGEEAVKALGDDIIDGVMGFAGQVGGFFSDLWGNISSGFSSALDGIGKFFGS